MERIKDLNKDIMIVEMGVKRKEFLIEENIKGENWKIESGVGEILEINKGRVKREKKWMRKIRMEWV